MLATVVLVMAISGGCGMLGSAAGECEVVNNGSAVTIEASKPERHVGDARAGSGDGDRRGGWAPDGSNDSGGGWSPDSKQDAEKLYPGGLTRDEWFERCPYDSKCRGVIPLSDDNPSSDEESTETEPAPPDVTTATIADVAAFAPAAPGLVGEPGDVGVVGMPTNFVSDASAHSVAGEIFDVPVTVRFTPVSYVFHYGDGATRETRSPGRTWAALGAPQFTATETSHSYRTAGTYDARVLVRYAAAANAGFGWFPVAGLLELSTDSTTVRVVEVQTALVERSCVEDPGGPGC